MVEERIAELLQSNTILQRIKNGLSVTELDIELLGRLLEQQSPYITEALLQKVYNNKKAKFIQFIRHLLGLETVDSYEAVVKKAFDGFIKWNSDFNTAQLEFLDILKQFILEKGILQKRDLVRPSFTNINRDGILGVFNQRQIQEILNITNQIIN